MRWKLTSQRLWKEYEERVKECFALGGIVAAIGCLVETMTGVCGPILVWGVFGALRFYYDSQDRQQAARVLHDKQQREMERSIREGTMRIFASCHACSTLADTALGQHSLRFRFVCQACIEKALVLLEESRHKPS